MDEDLECPNCGEVITVTNCDWGDDCPHCDVTLYLEGSAPCCWRLVNANED